MIHSVQQEIKDFVHELSTKDKLYLILLAAAMVRSVFVFVNFDSHVYQVWLDYFMSAGHLPYFDHPPLFFGITAALETFFGFMQSLGPYIYWSMVIVAFYGIYRFTEELSPYLFALLAYLLVYVSVIGYLGNFYEIAVIASFISGIIFVYVTYLIGSLKEKEIGLYAALFTAFAWWPIVYSNIVLIDMFASTLIIFSYYLYYRLIKAQNPSKSLYIASFVVLTLALYSKYYALAIGFPIGVYALYVYRNNFRTILTRLSPAIASTACFGVWALHTEFYFLSHYAATHYRFLAMPGYSSFFNFFYSAFTPLLFVIIIYGAFRALKNDKNYSVFILSPLVIVTIFHMLQVVLFRRSHSLINLTNYMLFIFPLAAILAAIAWRTIIDDTNKYVITTALVVTLILPIMGSSIQLEYDEEYTTPNLNVNSLNDSKFQALNLSETSENTLHYNYQFHREPVIWSTLDVKPAHFRWISPKEINIVAREPVRYRLDFSSVKVQNITVQSEDLIENLEVDEEKSIYIEAERGIQNFQFESKLDVPFVAKKTRCDLKSVECDIENGRLIS